ncbi:MAG: replication initiation protein [Bacteroidota bacterium]
MSKNKALLSNDSMNIDSQILVLSNDIAEFPPVNLSMHEWQVLIPLSAQANSRKEPLGIEDIKRIAEERGISTKEGEQRLMDEMSLKSRTYTMTFETFFSYYKGDSPLSRKTKHDLLYAMQSLHEKPVITANTNEMYASFSWFDAIVIDKKKRVIQYRIGQLSQYFLQGLKKNFLQVMAQMTVKEAKKHDWPIFIHMKSKIHSKKSAFSNIEPLQDFKNRFGHDALKSYNNWKDYYRRVLKPAEEYSQRSGDIAYKFEGIARRGRKVTHIKYSIWRTGNIHKPDEERQQDLFAKERRKKWGEAEAKMNEATFRAYEFLKAHGINKAFLLEECLFHSCTRHEAVVGFEDMFFQVLWKRFRRYSKASQPAGAFVVWWRRGKLTEGDHYWAAIEILSKDKKNLQQQEIDSRKSMATMTRQEYKEFVTRNKNSEEKLAQPPIELSSDKTKGFSSIGKILPKSRHTKKPDSFDIQVFKDEYGAEYKRIESELFHKLDELYSTARKGSADIDMRQMRKIEKQVQQMLPQHCEVWYNENILNTQV